MTAAKLLPMRRWRGAGRGPRCSQHRLYDKGCASVEKIGEGLYQHLPNPFEVFQTVLQCGGFSWLAKDGALLIGDLLASAPPSNDALRDC